MGEYMGAGTQPMAWPAGDGVRCVLNQALQLMICVPSRRLWTTRCRMEDSAQLQMLHVPLRDADPQRLWSRRSTRRRLKTLARKRKKSEFPSVVVLSLLPLLFLPLLNCCHCVSDAGMLSMGVAAIDETNAKAS